MTAAIEMIPKPVLAAFAQRAELPIRALASAMGRDIRTLQRHREAGELPVHIKGTGVTRRHYVCTLADVAEFYRRTGEACQYSGSKALPTSSSISRSNVIAFTAQQKSGMNVRLRKSKKRSEPKPQD